MLSEALRDPRSTPMGGICLWSPARSGPPAGLSSLTSSIPLPPPPPCRGWPGAFPSLGLSAGATVSFYSVCVLLCSVSPVRGVWSLVQLDGRRDRRSLPPALGTDGACLPLRVRDRSREPSERAPLLAVCPQMQSAAGLRLCAQNPSPLGPEPWPNTGQARCARGLSRPLCLSGLEPGSAACALRAGWGEWARAPGRHFSAESLVPTRTSAQLEGGHVAHFRAQRWVVGGQ